MPDNSIKYDIEITEHACKRYIERFNQNLQSISKYNERLIAARKAIKTIFNDSKYLSDSKKGVILISRNYSAKLIIRERVLITILPLSNKPKERERRLNNE